ncbi:hypothetical protein R83H12_01248 [Fibrobacteria bacterium R8-3-H12]
MTISGGTVQSTNTAGTTAVACGGTTAAGSIIVNGGTVLATGTSVKYDRITISGYSPECIIIAWDNPAGSTYTAFTSNDITKLPETATVVWLNKNDSAGIDYIYKINSKTKAGFIALSGVTVNKINPADTIVPTWPTSAAITYGQTLANAVFTGQAGAGTFAFTESTAIPTVAQSGTEYQATFTPTDTENYDWTGTALTQDVAITVNKAAGTFGTPDAVSATYTPTLKLSDLTLLAGYAWDAPTTPLSAGDYQTFAATYTDTSGNYNAANGTIRVNVAKATAATPTGLTAIEGQTLAEIALPADWAWANPTASVGAVGKQTRTAYYTPSDPNNYQTLYGIDVSVEVTADTTADTPIFPNRENPRIGRIGVQTIANAILLSNLPANAKVEVYNLQGKRVYSAYPENPLILKILVQTKGIYLLKIGTQTTRVVVK